MHTQHMSACVEGRKDARTTEMAASVFVVKIHLFVSHVFSFSLILKITAGGDLLKTRTIRATADDLNVQRGM